MTINELQPLVDLLNKLKPWYLSESDVDKIRCETGDRHGEFATRIPASECLLIMQYHRILKAKIEVAQLDGKDSV